VKDYLSQFLNTRAKNAGALESGNRQNRQKPDRKSGCALSSQPTKPTRGAFDAFVGDRSQARADFLPDAGGESALLVTADRIRTQRQRHDPENEGENIETAPRQRNGSFARPVICRGSWMPAECPWGTCAGQVESKGHGRYQCSTCSTWFELLPLEDPGGYVGDLAGDGAEEEL
jgi:hypothetical protein